MGGVFAGAVCAAEPAWWHLPGGTWPLEIWVDGELPGEVSGVAFALPKLDSSASGSS
jgi:hypothetical protein